MSRICLDTGIQSLATSPQLADSPWKSTMHAARARLQKSPSVGRSGVPLPAAWSAWRSAPRAA